MFRLTTEQIFYLPAHLRAFQIWPEMKTKVQNMTKCQFAKEPSTIEIFEMYP